MWRKMKMETIICCKTNSIRRGFGVLGFGVLGFWGFGVVILMGKSVCLIVMILPYS